MAGKKKEKKEAVAPKGITYYGWAIDSSGSMSGIQDEIAGAFNAQKKALVDDNGASGEARVSLVVFGENGGDVAIKYINEPLSRAEDLSRENYKPSGLTPMRDGLGLLITQLENIQLGPNDAVAIWVYSDGMENSSKEWTQNSLNAKIAEKEALPNWTFSYVGANQDSQEVSRGLSMDATNSLDWEASKSGVATVTATLKFGTENYLKSRAMGVSKYGNMYVNPEAPKAKSDEE